LKKDSPITPKKMTTPAASNNTGADTREDSEEDRDTIVSCMFARPLMRKFDVLSSEKLNDGNMENNLNFNS